MPFQGTPTDEQIDRQPAYIAEYIRWLQRTKRQLKDQLASHLDGSAAAGSNVVTYDFINPEQGVGKDARVRFYMGGTHREENSVCVNHNGPYELEVTTSGPGRLTFQPVSGNVMRVTLQDR